MFAIENVDTLTCWDMQLIPFLKITKMSKFNFYHLFLYGLVNIRGVLILKDTWKSRNHTLMGWSCDMVFWRFIGHKFFRQLEVVVCFGMFSYQDHIKTESRPYQDRLQPYYWLPVLIWSWYDTYQNMGNHTKSGAVSRAAIHTKNLRFSVCNHVSIPWKHDFWCYSDGDTFLNTNG